MPGFEIMRLGPCRYDSPMDVSSLVDDARFVLVDPTFPACRAEPPVCMELGGARRKIFFHPARTKAAIVTCGGLCPGLNDVIRALTMVLWHRDGVREVVGLRYGYEGLESSYNHPIVPLDPEIVADIHQGGGTVLGTSRGEQDPAAMVDFLDQQGISILFAIGGDGTQRGASRIVQEIQRRGLEIAVVGVPKTIDNDIMWTDRTFGFETAVAMSGVPVEGIHMEAKAVRNGVGLVKLMGRDSGFVAGYATLASSDVNLVLIPEVPFHVPSLLNFLEKRLARKSHVVIVVAEGAGQDLVPTVGTDASGNKKLGDIGLFLKEQIAGHFVGLNRPVNVRYVDPSYTIRSAPANPDDSVFCFRLSRYAVHAAMAGCTGMVVSLWNGRFVHVPMEKSCEGRKRIDPAGSLWQSVLDNTGQPPQLV